MGLKRTDEFRADAVRIALTNGLTRKQAADDLGVGMLMLKKWITAHRDTDVVSEEDLDLAKENDQLRRENRTALLQKGRLRRECPFPVQVQATRTTSAVPSALKRLIRATRMWISAVWRSGSLAAMRSPKAFRHRILASTRLRAWYPQNARP